MRASDDHFYLQDANFNVTAAVDESTNTVVERYHYSPYGEVTVLNGGINDPDNTGSPDTEWQADPDGLSDIGNEFLYTGRRLDPETGLQQSRYRYYHAGLGRWVNRDPIGYRGGMNLYGYVGGKPTKFVDPSGTEQHYFDREWIGQSGCFDYCVAAGNSAHNCYHYCHEANSHPGDWPELKPKPPRRPGGRPGKPDEVPSYPPTWIVDDQPIKGSEDYWENWEPDDDFEQPDGSETCKCLLSPVDDRVNIERPIGQLENPSVPGIGNATCVVGEIVLAEYKGVCRGANCACEEDERGGCKVLVLWRCEQTGSPTANWQKTKHFVGKCDERK